MKAINIKDKTLFESTPFKGGFILNGVDNVANPEIVLPINLEKIYRSLCIENNYITNVSSFRLIDEVDQVCIDKAGQIFLCEE